MADITKFRAAEFVNVHGKPVGVTMQQLVQRAVPKAWCHYRWLVGKSSNEPRDWYTIRVPEYDDGPVSHQSFIGTGATEEAAWRDAYFQLTGGGSNE